MGKCAFCLKETENKVNDNLGGKSYLCDECKDLFTQCNSCYEYYLDENIENGLCENCK